MVRMIFFQNHQFWENVGRSIACNVIDGIQSWFGFFVLQNAICLFTLWVCFSALCGYGPAWSPQLCKGLWGFLKEKTYRYIILAFPRLQFLIKKEKEEQSLQPQPDSLTRSALPLYITTITRPRPQLNTYVSKVLDTFALQNNSGCLISRSLGRSEVDEEHKSHHILMSTYYSRLPHTGKK
jgi:hypothetical protein